MQEQSLEQEGQTGREYSGYRADSSYESEQQKKIYPQEQWGLQGKALWMFTLVLSSIGFFLTVAGIVASAIVLKYAHGQEILFVGGVIGLISSIGAMLISIAIFVIAVVVLAGWARGVSR